MKIDNLYSRSDITGLEYNDNRLFIGNGKYLEIYCLLTNQQLIKSKIFEIFNINGIYVYFNQNRTNLIIYGNRFFKIYELNSSLDQSNQIENQLNNQLDQLNLKNNFKYQHSNQLIELKLILDELNVYDWILEAEFKDNRIYCLLSDNKLGIYNLELNKLDIINCDQKCTIYTAKFLINFNNENIDKQLNRFVASGTVFSEILILNYSINEQQCKIIDRLIGHDGVLFSIDYRKELDLLISASDDRTIRLWYFNNESKLFECKHILYGHEARIWNIKLTLNYIISVGECSNLIFWSIKDAKILFKEKSKKQNYWRLVVDEKNDRIFYGSNDGSIKKRSINNTIKQNELIYLNVKNIKSFELFKQNSKPEQLNLFSISTDGKSKLINLKNNLNTILEYDFGDQYSNYNNLVLDENQLSKGILCNLNGELTRFKIINNQLEVIKKKKLTIHKLSNLFIIDNQLITSDQNGEINIFNLENDNFELITKFNLPTIPKTAQINCCLKLNDNLFVFGDRLGNVIIYEKNYSINEFSNNTSSTINKLDNQLTNQNNFRLIKLFKKIHGIHGVKCLKIHPIENKFYSCGRDGLVIEYNYRLFNELDDKSYELENNQTLTKLVNQKIDLLRTIKIGINEIDWICDIEFDQLTGKLEYIFGFKTTLFIVWNNITQSIIWTLDSSGGNRPFKLYFNKLTMKLNFIYLKNDKLIYTTKQLNDGSLLIKSKYHTNTILCGRQLFDNHLIKEKSIDKFYFLTASEDSNLFINCFNRETNLLSIEDQLDGHNSNIRSLAIEYLNVPNGYLKQSLVVSAGGASQLIIWNIKLDLNFKLISKQIVNYFLTNLDKHSKKPWINQDLNSSQIRFMDINLKKLYDQEYLITIICSDSYLRLFRLSLNKLSIELISKFSISKYCPLKLINLNESNDRQLNIITSTDGNLRFIEFDNLNKLNKINLNTNFSLDSISLVLNQSNNFINNLFELKSLLKMNEFGINAIDLIKLKNNDYLVFTCGEDTSLGYALINYNMNCLTIKMKSNCLLNHYSMISNIKIINDELLITASWDKRIKLWNFKLIDNELKLNCLNTIISNLSDINDLIVNNCNEYFNLIVLGNSIEIYKIYF